MTQSPGSNGPPPISTLKTGDLLFPRPKGGWVPYFRPTGGNPANPEDQPVPWDTIRAGISGPKLVRSGAAAHIAPMSKADITRAYWGEDATSADLGSGFYVGHVAIFDDGDIIEALWGSDKKVVKGPYANWQKTRADHDVWVSRLTEPEERRLAFVKQAQSQVSKPYDFFDFDLNDDSGFYCSKLVWLAAFRALDFAMDGNRDPRRLFWYSPKQLLHSPHLEPIQSPGNYAL